MSNIQVIYSLEDRSNLLFTYDPKDKTMIIVGMNCELLDKTNVVYKDDKIILIDFLGGHTLYAPLIWGPTDEKESCTDLGAINKLFEGLLVNKILVNETANTIKLILKEYEPDITAKLRIKEYRTEKSLESLAV